MIFNKQNFKESIKSVAPHGLVAHRVASMHKLRLKEFYEDQLGIRGGQLVFDVGANVGDKTHVFRMIGCHVVAFEPQDSCVNTLRSRFSKDKHVTIVPIGLASNCGRLELRLASNSQLTSFSEEFVSQAQRHGRFSGATWNQTSTVQVSTLDNQIDQFGVPDFVKIDVEGFESAVLKGLSRRVSKLSFEWTPERTAAVAACVERCLELELSEFNISINETSTLNFTEWVSSKTLLRLTSLLSGNISMFGDIYARKASR